MGFANSAVKFYAMGALGCLVSRRGAGDAERGTTETPGQEGAQRIFRPELRRKGVRKGITNKEQGRKNNGG
jgi:hypothetical protein